MSKEFEDEQFHATKNSSMGDDGIAIKNSIRYDGYNSQSEKFEGEHPGKSVGAKEAEYEGRQ
jgi:hypothetical protein